MIFQVYLSESFQLNPSFSFQNNVGDEERESSSSTGMAPEASSASYEPGANIDVDDV